MHHQSDADLISRSLARPAEFGTIFDRHAQTLLRFLIRREGPDVAAGLLGELFRVALRTTQHFRFESTQCSAMALRHRVQSIDASKSL